MGDILKNGETYKLNLSVIESPLKNNLLSHSVSRKSRPDEVSKVPTVGQLHVDPVRIQLKEGSEPYAVHTARNVGFHLMSKVEDEYFSILDANSGFHQVPLS
jgi:hypothetical protein